MGKTTTKKKTKKPATEKKTPTRGPGRPPKPTKVRQAEAKELAAALRRARGNANKAARELGIARRTLYHRAEKYGIDPNDFRPEGWKYEGPKGGWASQGDESDD